MAPETRYALSGDLHIAYQVVGDGPVDVVWVPGWISNIDHYWEEPTVARYFNRIASFFRWLTVQVTRRANSARPNEVAVIPPDERAEFGG